MAFRRTANPQRDKQWRSWLAAHRRELEDLGLPLAVYETVDHWNEFLDVGDVERFNRDLPFSFADLTRDAMAQLADLLERFFPDASILGFMRVRLAEPDRYWK